MDYSYLLDLCHGEKLSVIRFLQEAIPFLTETHHNLTLFAREKNEDLFMRELHKIKGSLGLLEPRILYLMAVRLEKVVQKDGLQLQVSEYENFASQLVELRTEIELFLHQNKR